MTAQSILDGTVLINKDCYLSVLQNAVMGLLLEMKNVMIIMVIQEMDVTIAKSKIFSVVQDSHQFVSTLAEMEFFNKKPMKFVMMEIMLKTMDV